MEKQDRKVLDAFRDNATLRNDVDELDALDTIEDNLRGVDQSGRRRGFWDVETDERARYHDWTEKELKVLERMRLLSAKPIVYVLNMDEKDFANSSSNFLKAQKYFERGDKDALLLRFAGEQHSTRNASLSEDCQLRGATTFLGKTLDHYHIAHFYTASQELVAAWTFKLGTTFAEAAKLVNATFGPNVFVVEVANIREVIKAGSIEKAHSLGFFQRRSFADEVEDGDVLSTSEPHEATGEITVSVSATTLASSGSAAPTSEEGRGTSYWVYVLLACILVQTMLLGAFRLLRDENLRTRVRTFVDTHFRRRGSRGEALLGEVSYEAESESQDSKELATPISERRPSAPSIICLAR